MIPHLSALSLPSSRLFTAATLQQSEYALLSQCLPSHLSGSPSQDAREARLSLRDCRALLKYLQRDKRAVVADSENEVGGEMCFPGEATRTDACLTQVYKVNDSPEEALAATVTEADKGTVAIQSTLSKLDVQIDEINGQIAG